MDPTETLEPGKQVVIWRVEVVFIEKPDWKYESSGAGPEGGGRTHTFGLYHPAKKLRDKAVYRRGDVKLLGGKPVPVNGD